MPKFGRIKAVTRTALFIRSDWAVPFSERKRDEAKLPLHYRFDPQRLLSKNTARMGDRAKPLVFRGPAALLCELSLFVLAITSRKIEMQSDPRASDI